MAVVVVCRGGRPGYGDRGVLVVVVVVKEMAFWMCEMEVLVVVKGL